MIERNKQLRAANPDADNATPVDLLTASASGLDPNISIDAALYQAPRVAKSRQIPLDAVKSLIEMHTEQALLPF